VEYLRGEIKSGSARRYGLVRQAPYFVDTSTRTGFDKLARWSLATLVVIVAENKYVVRSFGIALRIASMSGPKSMSSKRSASSRTLRVATLGLTARNRTKEEPTERLTTTHQKLEATQTEPLRVLQVILQPPRSRHNDVWLLGQRN